ncbi:hypothetical protein D3C73_1124210 [compost metagenome]
MLGNSDIGGQGAHPGRIETTGMQLRQHAFEQDAFAFGGRMIVARQAPPRTRALQRAVVEQVLQQGVPQAARQRGQGAALQPPAVDARFVGASIMPAAQRGDHLFTQHLPVRGKDDHHALARTDAPCVRRQLDLLGSAAAVALQGCQRNAGWRLMQ